MSPVMLLKGNNNLRQFENFEIYKGLYGNLSSVIGWQELYFPYTSF